MLKGKTVVLGVTGSIAAYKTCELISGLKKKNYKQMYQMLNSKTVYTPTQKYFVEKYKEFFEEIDANNIQIKIKKNRTFYSILQ